MSIFTHFRKKGLGNTKIELAFRKFAKEVISKAKQNLNRAKKGGGNLEKSLQYKLEISSGGSLSLDMLADFYADFVDKGVSGTEKRRMMVKLDGSRKKSPYSYTSKRPPASVFSKWIIKKGLKGSRDKNGRFVSRKSMQFAIAESIYKRGIKASPFFTNAFRESFTNMDQKIVEAFALDIAKMLTTMNIK